MRRPLLTPRALWLAAAMAVIIAIAAAGALYSLPDAAIRGRATPQGYDYEIVTYHVESGLARKTVTSFCIGTQNGASDFRDAFLIVDEPNFIDLTITFVDENTLGYWLHPGREKDVLSQRSTVHLPGRERPIEVQYYGIAPTVP